MSPANLGCKENAVSTGFTGPANCENKASVIANTKENGKALVDWGWGWITEESGSL